MLISVMDSSCRYMAVLPDLWQVFLVFSVFPSISQFFPLPCPKPFFPRKTWSHICHTWPDRHNYVINCLTNWCHTWLDRHISYMAWQTDVVKKLINGLTVKCRTWPDRNMSFLLLGLLISQQRCQPNIQICQLVIKI